MQQPGNLSLPRHRGLAAVLYDLQKCARASVESSDPLLWVPRRHRTFLQSSQASRQSRCSIKRALSLTSARGRGRMSCPGEAVGTYLPWCGAPPCSSFSTAMPITGLLFNLRGTVKTEQIKRSKFFRRKRRSCWSVKANWWNTGKSRHLPLP